MFCKHLVEAIHECLVDILSLSPFRHKQADEDATSFPRLEETWSSARIAFSFFSGIAGSILSFTICHANWPGLWPVVFFKASLLSKCVMMACGVVGLVGLILTELIFIRCGSVLKTSQESIASANFRLFLAVALTPLLAHWAVHNHHLKILIWVNNFFLVQAAVKLSLLVRHNRMHLVRAWSELRKPSSDCSPPDNRFAAELGKTLDDLSLWLTGTSAASHSTAANTGSRTCVAFSVAWFFWLPSIFPSFR